MKIEFRYSLEPGSKKHRCPTCGKIRFVRYIDNDTKEYLPEIYGRCERIGNCAYHLNPYTDGYVKRIREQEHCESPIGKSNPLLLPNRPKPIPAPISLIPFDTLKASRRDYDQNNLIVWLTELFGTETVTELIRMYHIGTSSHWPGATIFWQIDLQYKIRTGKIMQYDPATGKRVKKPINLIAWVHKVKNIENFNLQQCYFGEHLLEQYQDKPVGIVESEKTALIASVYFRQFVWLAVGSLTNLNIDRCKVLAGRDVYLFPDLNGFENWKIKANELSRIIPSTRFVVDDYLEQNASETDKVKGLDIADYLIRFDWQTFRKNENNTVPKYKMDPYSTLENEKSEKSEPPKDYFFSRPERPIRIDQDQLCSEQTHEIWMVIYLFEFFELVQIPEVITLDQYGVITDPRSFIREHLDIIDRHYRDPACQIYYDRLIQLKNILTNKQINN